MAAMARDVTTTAAGNNSGSNFTSACRCRCQPSSDLKLTKLFMHDLETQLLDLAPVKPYLWLRYIDDIFMIWTAGEEQLQKFLYWINQYHDTIKFT